jgi:hypothetical protein
MATAMATVSAAATGGRGWPFGMPDATEVDDHGYVMEEFLATGVATRLETVDGQPGGADGRWVTTQIDPRPFTTRFVVIRPREPSAANGAVVVNWQNVTAGIDVGRPTGREIWRGYTWVGITAQKVALTGLNGTTGLPDWDPERYGSLEHPGDPYAYAIFTAVARAVGCGRARRPVDPLDGLDVTTVIATGASQSASRLGSYINGAHQHEEFFDAFLPTVHWGVCPPPDEPRATVTATGDIVGTQRMRDDQGVPVLVVNSETEAWSMFPVRQPDTETYRFWEIAGGAHSGDRPIGQLEALLARDQVVRFGGLDAPNPTANTLDWSYVLDAALRGAARWAGDGTPPPSFDRIEMAYGDPLRSIERDELGGARGGLRLPEVDVPVAVQLGVNTAPDMLLKLSGERRPIPRDELRSRYGDADGYMRRYRDAAQRAVESGAVLADDLTELEGHGQQLASAAGLR